MIESPAAAAAALDPVRARLLGELAEPASAAALAARVGIARQKVNYHLKALEAHGLVELAEERRHGGITERVLRATAASYVVSPAALGAAAVDPAPAPITCRRATSSRWRAGWFARSAPWRAGPARPASACRRWPSTPRSASARPPTGPRSRTS